MKRMVFLFLFLLPLSAAALDPHEILPDAALETRARAISADLRCLVCQNQSIDDSDAELAHDLRVLVRARLRAGDTDEQVRAYIADRYGKYVLMTPPVNAATLLLWAGPLLLLLAGGAGLWAFFRKSQRVHSVGD